MFKFFKKKSDVEQLIDSIKDAADAVKPVVPPGTVKAVEEDHPAYQIGKTANGKTTLRMQNNHGYTTLTMNNEGVDQLIRMLEAAKEPETQETNPTNDE